MQNTFTEFLLLHAEIHQGLCFFGHGRDPFFSVFHMIFQKASKPHPLFRGCSGDILHFRDIKSVLEFSDLHDPRPACCQLPQITIFHADLVLCEPIPLRSLGKCLPESPGRRFSRFWTALPPEYCPRTRAGILIHAEGIVVKTHCRLCQPLFRQGKNGICVKHSDGRTIRKNDLRR